MTTPVGHTLFVLMVFLMTPRSGRRQAFILLALLMLAAFSPDFDLFPLLWGDLATANHYHQEFTHSLLFTAAVAILFSYAASRLRCGRVVRLLPFFLAAAWSHLLLDMLTSDSREPIGILLLWPFSEWRFISPVPVFGGIIKGEVSDLLSWHNVMVIAGEVLVLAPVVVLIWLIGLCRARFNSGRGIVADEARR